VSRLVAIIVLSMGLLVSGFGDAATEEPWTLEASVKRVLEIAPEMRTAEANIGVRQGELTQAGTWPNPNVSGQIDNKLGVEDGSGGYGLRQLAISQPLPLRRLGYQKKMAEANLTGAERRRDVERLRLENDTAHAYHLLQFAQAKLDLATRRLEEADAYLKGRKGKGPLVRYLTRLERLRLDVMRQEAQQAVASAEGEYSESVSRFDAYLGLPKGTQPRLAPLAPPALPPSLPTLQAQQQTHPVFGAAQQDIAAAQAGIDVARAHRLADPVVSVFRERDYFNGVRDEFNGIGLSVQIPLWSRNNGGVSAARAEAMKAESQLQAQQRDLGSRLTLSHQHLGHLIEQAEHYRTTVLVPSEQMLALTSKAFNVGQANLLNLIDANNTYFESRTHYLQLVEDASLEAADLRLAAGLSVLDAGVKP
jgi:cobalt-zinc-cadmium efflux system outer membrane protein